MAYHMSPPAQKPPPNPYPPPYQSSGSPHPGNFAQPPAKRQRLSPDPRSPANGSPVYQQSPVYGNPYGPPQQMPSPYSPQSYATSPPQSSFNTPQAYSPPAPWPSQQQQQQSPQRPTQMSPQQTSSQMMPPPPKPIKEEKEERVGVDDIGDSLFGSGINLKDEENYLHNTWNNRHSQNESFTTTQSTSFGSSTMSPSNSFNLLTQGTSFGSHSQDGAQGGAVGQARSQEDIENEQKRKREAAAKRRAEAEQHHLKNQFLQGNCLRNRMQQRATESSVRLDIQGVYIKNPEPQQTQIMMNGERTEGIAATKVRPEAMIEAGVAYEHIISLISLAAGERLRGMVEEAYSFARARRYGDHGRVVPPEFADIATGEGKQSQETVIPESITGSQWDKTQDPALEGVNGDVDTNGDKSTPTPPPAETISFQGNLSHRLIEIAERDRLAEKERQKKRDSRKRKAEDISGDGAGADAETTAANEAMAAAAASKASKKEQTKKAKESQASSETQAFNQSNQTAAMMALGGRKNRYSWMSGGAQNMPTNRFAKPGSGTSTPKGVPEPANAAASEVVKKDEEKKTPTWGDWREDDIHGKGIQLRDWILVLDRDGKNKKALQKAMTKLA